MSLRDHFLFPHSPATRRSSAELPAEAGEQSGPSTRQEGAAASPDATRAATPKNRSLLRPLTRSPNRSCSPPEQHKRRNPRSAQLGRARKGAGVVPQSATTTWGTGRLPGGCGDWKGGSGAEKEREPDAQTDGRTDSEVVKPSRPPPHPTRHGQKERNGSPTNPAGCGCGCCTRPWSFFSPFSFCLHAKLPDVVGGHRHG
jgi:hypothetical protein